ncbi:MAG: glycosyltransferase involved in cell wall biosynthesis [Alteromonas macleodii]|jgi:glycosyltransferase involved in cell wall biosynthesis
MHMRLLSFIIPVYNNELTLRQLCGDIITLCGQQQDLEYEIILIDDGSSDESSIIMQELNVSNSKIRFVKFTSNFGQVTAITAGLERVKGDAIVIRSADLQDPVNLIEKFIAGWNQGNKVVIANRSKRSDGIIHRLQSALFYKLIRTVSPTMPKGGFDYCLIDKQVADELKKFKHRNRFLQGDILSLGFSTQFIPYERLEDVNAKQRKKRSLSSSLKYSIDGILDSTYLPIRFMSVLGVICMLGGIAYSGLIVFARITDNVPFDGWAPLMILILLIGGMLMLMMGIMGEYVWRIYDQLKKRPDYIIEKESE